jgi:hypothetical protein
MLEETGVFVVIVIVVVVITTTTLRKHNIVLHPVFYSQMSDIRMIQLPVMTSRHPFPIWTAAPHRQVQNGSHQKQDIYIKKIRSSGSKLTGLISS